MIWYDITIIMIMIIVMMIYVHLSNPTCKDFAEQWELLTSTAEHNEEAAYINIYIYVYIYIYIHTHTHMHTYMHACMRT